MYQALQNVMHGFGSICGASFGGSIVDSIGWRWCFLVQAPVGLLALITGHLVIHLPRKTDLIEPGQGLRAIWQRIDLSGACVLILGLSSQLVGLSLGGNDLPWSNIWVISSLVSSVILLGAFVVIETKTSAIPLIPPRMLRGLLPIATQVSNVCVGMAAYAVCFVTPFPQLELTLVVSLYSPIAIPGHSLGFCRQGWCETGDSVPRDPSGWCYFRHCHVPLGQIGPTCTRGRFADVHRKLASDVTAIQRRWVEVLYIRNSSKPRPGHRVPRDFVHVPCRIRPFWYARYNAYPCGL